MYIPRRLALVLLALAIGRLAHADVFSYEAVGNAGRNNTIDSNALSCDTAEGCYTNLGARCSDNPNQLCNLQIVPAGRCTYGSLTSGVGPFGTSCVFPHWAGRCAVNPKVGCSSNAQCADVGGACDLTISVFGELASSYGGQCNCQGTDAAAPDFEIAICGGSLSVCSDGDPMRDVGGLGVARGMELKVGGAGAETFAGLGPSLTGSGTPSSSPAYPIENPPISFDPQRDAGSVARAPAQGIGPIRPIRTTEAREVVPYVHPAIGTPVDVRKMKSFGDSYWEDWAFVSSAVSGTYNTHDVRLPCDPPVGWIVGTPVSGGLHCHELARDGLTFLWARDLTPAEIAAYTVGGQRVCPPNCNKDFELSPPRCRNLVEAGAMDPYAGLQLAIQSGEEAAGRQAGLRDAIGVSVFTWTTFLVDTDLRCKVGGWGNAPGVVGRCSNGSRVCAPGSAGDAVCAAAPSNGSSCRTCMGPYDSITNPLGLPIGYATHGRPELDLVSGQRIGGIAGQSSHIRLPLIVVGTTGNAAADFRDLADEGAPAVDLADLGPVDPNGAPFASGVGAGGTFANGVALNIDEPCCLGGLPVPWDAAALGSVLPGFENGFSYRYGPGGGDVTQSDWARTYDIGPGPDGIPGCIGDNAQTLNGFEACTSRLGKTAEGPKTDGFYATGKDDRVIRYTVGSTQIPASAARFNWRSGSPWLLAYFGFEQIPPVVNTVSAFTVRDISFFVPRSADLLVKMNTTWCPLTSGSADCGSSDDNCLLTGGDTDFDGVCDSDDNCPYVSNPSQSDAGGVGAAGADGIGDVCQCGDVTGDGRVLGSDVFAIRTALAAAGGPMAAPERCSVTGAIDAGVLPSGARRDCDVADFVRLERALATLPLGAAQVCESAVP